MKQIFLLVLLACLWACATGGPTYGPYVWKEKASDTKDFDTMFIIGACEVHIRTDGKAAMFVAVNPHWPEGRLTYSTTVEKSTDRFEVSHSHSIVFRRGYDDSYPVYPFLYEWYDVFYSDCYQAAKSLPERVQPFLKAYSTKTYLEYIEKKKGNENLTTHHNVRRFYLNPAFN